MLANFSVTRYSSPALASRSIWVWKSKHLEDVAHRRRERLHVGEQVFLDVVLVAHQLLHVERRRVVEQLARLLAAGTALDSARAFSRFSNSASTAGFVASSTQSSRRSTVNGRMTLPYSDCL